MRFSKVNVCNHIGNVIIVFIQITHTYYLVPTMVEWHDGMEIALKCMGSLDMLCSIFQVLFQLSSAYTEYDYFLSVFN